MKGDKALLNLRAALVTELGHPARRGASPLLPSVALARPDEETTDGRAVCRENRMHGSVGGGESPLPNRPGNTLVGSAVRTD